MLPLLLFWLLEPLDSISEEELWVDLDELSGLNDPINDSYFDLFTYDNHESCRNLKSNLKIPTNMNPIFLCQKYQYKLVLK